MSDHRGRTSGGSNYYIDGKQHREKAGTKQAAISLYRKRKADDREGKKLPDLRNKRFVTVAELIDDALVHVKHHKDLRNYESKAVIVKKALGGKKAEDLKPKEIAAWLNSHCKTPATYNRYKAFLSLCYRLGEENEKIERNPARKAPHRKESNARVRFLSREDEYPRLYAAIEELFPSHLAEFVVSIHSGMRISDQYTVDWNQVHFDRKAIELSKSKNGDARTVHLKADAIAVIESMRRPGKRMKGRGLPEAGRGQMVQQSVVVLALPERGQGRRVHVALQPPHLLLLACDGRSFHERDSRGGRHKTISMSARYSHLSPAHRLSVVERIASARSGNQHAPEVNNVTVRERR